MNINIFNDSPLKTLISFHKLIELEEIALSNIDYPNYAKAVLKKLHQ
jgi:hypothetical protein